MTVEQSCASAAENECVVFYDEIAVEHAADWIENLFALSPEDIFVDETGEGRFFSQKSGW